MEWRLGDGERRGAFLAGGFLDDRAATLGSRELPRLCRETGRRDPPDAPAILQALLTVRVAETRWGGEGAYRALAQRDAAIRAAMTGFGRAGEVLKAAH